MTGRAMLLLAAGFSIWVVAFVILYSMLSVGCAFGWDGIKIAGLLSLQRLQLIALFLLHVGAVLALTLFLRRRARRSFLHGVGYAASFAALGATFCTYVAVFFLSPCI